MGRSLIEKKAKIPITIKQSTGNYVDGKPQFSDIPALCMFFDMSQKDIDYFGTIKNGKIFMVAPIDDEQLPDQELKLPGKIIHGSREYDLKGIKTYRNTKSEILGYKCAVAGAG